MKKYDKLNNDMKLSLPTAATISNKTVLVRVDFNVPINKKGGNKTITDDRRIQASLNTISFLLKHNARIILVSHLGRPKGKSDSDLSLQPVADHLAQVLKQPVELVRDYFSTKKKEALPQTQIILLENVRFYPQEKQNDAAFGKYLASLADVYINEAFSAAHRKHASVVAVTKYLPSLAGFALEEEVTHLNQLMQKPKRPFVMVIGGAKISDKVSAIKNLSHIADTVLVGGGVANNFLKADGFNIARSYLEDTPVDAQKEGINFVEFADDLLDENQQEHSLLNGYIPIPKIIYPIDVIAARSINSEKIRRINLLSKNGKKSSMINKSDMYLDIGPKTIQLFSQIISQAKTIFWNGPMGVFEKPHFVQGTKKIAQAIAQSKATSILGGGDTIAAINQFKLNKKYSYISAAGGAALAFLAGKPLPGLKPLEKK